MKKRTETVSQRSFAPARCRTTPPLPTTTTTTTAAEKESPLAVERDGNKGRPPVADFPRKHRMETSKSMENVKVKKIGYFWFPLGFVVFFFYRIGWGSCSGRFWRRRASCPTPWRSSPSRSGSRRRRSSRRPRPGRPSWPRASIATPADRKNKQTNKQNGRQ